MANQFSDVTKNALFAMVDLFLDYVQEEEVESQKGNISEFVIDCHNVEESEPEFLLLQAKFEEEFREVDYFETMNKEELTTVIKDGIKGLFHTIEGEDSLPLLIQKAIEKTKGAV